MFSWVSRIRRNRQLHDDIWRALWNNDVAEVISLVDQGADIEAPCQSNEPDPPLVYVSYEGQLDLARTLLSLGANVNTSGMEQMTPLMAAVSGGHINMVKLLLENHARIDGTDSAGKSAVDHAMACPDQVNRLIILEMLQRTDLHK